MLLKNPTDRVVAFDMGPREALAVQVRDPVSGKMVNVKRDRRHDIRVIPPGGTVEIEDAYCKGRNFGRAKLPPIIHMVCPELVPADPKLAHTWMEPPTIAGDVDTSTMDVNELVANGYALEEAIALKHPELAAKPDEPAAKAKAK